MIVTKFGGSSLADSAQFKKVKDIIKANPARRVVVVSAPGKRSSSDNKITDLLYTLGSHLKYGVPDDKIWVSIVNRYKEIKETLNLDIDIEAELEAYSKTFGKDIDQDCLVSRGEYFCARLMSSYLGYTFVDAAEVIRFSYDGKLDVAESEKRMRAAEDVAAYKTKNNLPVFDSAREQQVIERNLALITDEKLKPYYKDMLVQLMRISKEYQNAIMADGKKGEK